MTVERTLSSPNKRSTRNYGNESPERQNKNYFVFRGLDCPLRSLGYKARSLGSLWFVDRTIKVSMVRLEQIWTFCRLPRTRVSGGVGVSLTDLPGISESDCQSVPRHTVEVVSRFNVRLLCLD